MPKQPPEDGILDHSTQPKDKAGMTSIAAQDPIAYEAEHVHGVYEQIASHFSATRYKPWPGVARFLAALAPGSVGLDVGCGNGKYFVANPEVFLVGCDRSARLVGIATGRTTARTPPTGAARAESAACATLCADACVADGLDLPHPLARFDFAISVAVVHHWATRERRVEAVKALLDSVRADSGRVLICTWALEQQSSRRGWDRGMAQDVLVPWVMKGQRDSGVDKTDKGQTFERFYHLYREGELEADVDTAGGIVIEGGYEADNWWVIAKRPLVSGHIEQAAPVEPVRN